MIEEQEDVDDVDVCAKQLKGKYAALQIITMKFKQCIKEKEYMKNKEKQMCQKVKEKKKNACQKALKKIFEQQKYLDTIDVCVKRLKGKFTTLKTIKQKLKNCLEQANREIEYYQNQEKKEL